MKEPRAEQRERSEDEDQLRGRAVRHVPVVASIKEAQEETEKVLKGNRVAILSAESEQVSSRRA